MFCTLFEELHEPLVCREHNHEHIEEGKCKNWQSPTSHEDPVLVSVPSQDDLTTTVKPVDDEVYYLESRSDLNWSNSFGLDRSRVLVNSVNGAVAPAI